MSIINLTIGVSTDDPVSNYGFSYYDEATTGYPGAPFGAVDAQLYGYDVVYLAFGPDGAGGFRFYVWTTDDAGAPGTMPTQEDFTFSSASFVDDNAVTWTFNKADALNPDGNTFSFDVDDIREFAWAVNPSALPVVTQGNVYAISFNGVAAEPLQLFTSPRDAALRVVVPAQPTRFKVPK